MTTTNNTDYSVYKPKYIRELERKMRHKLDGKEFSLLSESYDAGLNMIVETSREPSKYMEDVCATLAKQTRSTTEKTVKREPNGARTFPDIEVTLGNNYKHYLEVKTWISRNRGWHAANSNKFYTAIDSGDMKYFDAWYMDSSLTLQENSVLVEKTSLGRIYEFSKGNRLSGSNAGFTANGSSSATEFLENAYNLSESLYPEQSFNFRRRIDQAIEYCYTDPQLRPELQKKIRRTK